MHPLLGRHTETLQEGKTFHYTELSVENLLLLAYETRNALKLVVAAVKKPVQG